MEFSRGLIEKSGYDRANFAAHYDRYRPRPPRVLLEILCRYARVAQPALVVDLGCGTGLSTRAWSGIADRVAGIEPNPAMLAVAEVAPGVEYREAFAHRTDVADETADIVTCSQSLHWMEPEPIFAEAARILRPGGVFAAYDYDTPPGVEPEIDAAFIAYLERRKEARRARGIQRGGDRWRKEEHFGRMRASGYFGFCRELVLHSIAEGGAEQICGFARSIGLPVADDTLEQELRIDELEEVVERVLDQRTVPIHFGYRVRLGVR